MQTMIQYWRKFDANKRPYIHPSDEALLNEQYYAFHDYDEYCQSKAFGKDDSRFHLNLLPSPYDGDILRASVYILLLNPGFSPIDYYVESTSHEIREAMLSTIRQDLHDIEYPLIWLNPKYLWTGGGTWLERKFKDILLFLVNTKGLSYQDALKHLSKKISVIEMYPYHSQSFNLKKSTQQGIFSRQIAKNFVRGYVVERAKENKACIISLRRSKEWELPSHDNIILYGHREARAASLSMRTAGGKKILEFV